MAEQPLPPSTTGNTPKEAPPSGKHPSRPPALGRGLGQILTQENRDFLQELRGENQPNETGGNRLESTALVTRFAKRASDLLPQRLKGLFTRNQPQAEPQPFREATTHQKTPQIAPAEQTASGVLEIHTPEPTRGVATEQDTTLFHPDIEQGARDVLERQLVKDVQIGNTAGIEGDIRNLADAWKQAQKAAGVTLELTPEGKAAIPERVKEICAAHLQEGLANRYEMVEFGVQQGREQSISEEPPRLAKLYQIADEFQIPLTYSPPQEGVPTNANIPAILITTAEQAQAHLQEVINRNLPQGIHGIVETLGDKVGSGLLKNLPDYERQIERWVDIMQKRGWTVVDQPPSAPVMGGERAGVLVRQVNRAEIRQLVDQAVRDNLAKGARYISEMVATQIQHGWFDPLSTWGTPENIALYTEAGQRYGLTHRGGMTEENGEVHPDLYFDPTQLPEQVREAVQQNLPKGLEVITKNHLDNIHSGDASQVKFGEQTMEQYITLAGKYGVTVNPDRLRAALSAHFTPENLQEYVRGKIAEIKKMLQTANYSGVSVRSREAEEFRLLVHERGFDGKVDFSELDQYLQETATQAPRLTEGKSVGV